jgi:predicted DNA-binding mobile mystery protein A
MARRPTRLDQKQLEARFARLREFGAMLQPPRGGWLRSLRNALGMRQRDLGDRLGMTAQGVADLERREADGTVTLNTLREAARALGGELHYVVVPVRPVKETLEERATRLARFMAGQVHHSMRMEDQGTGAQEQQDRFEEIRESLLKSPSVLWTLPDDL